MLSLEYAAGFFDGEGCVNLTVSGRERRVVLRLMIVNTDPNILCAFQAQFGGEAVTSRQNGPSHWKQFRMLKMTGQTAMAFLEDIAPYVRVKAAQVALALEFWDYTRRPKSERCIYVRRASGVGATGQLKPEVIAKEHEFKTHMHLLNKRGA